MVQKKRIPKKGDRVSVRGRNGTFVVYGVDTSIMASELKMIGRDLALSTIPWRDLTFIEELDSSQNALRIVRETTENK